MVRQVSSIRWESGETTALHSKRLPAPSWGELDKLTQGGTWKRGKFEAWLKEQRFSAIDEAALMARLEALAAS